MNNKIIKLIGLYQGDGLTSIKSATSRRTFSFGNTEPILNKFIINTLENHFNIKRNKLKFQLQIKNKSKIKQNQNFWASYLNINLNFRKSQINPYQASKNGLISIIYENKKFKEDFNLLLNKIKNLAEKRKGIAIEYLKGIIASDGDIGLEKNKSISRVRISGTTLNDLKHYQRVLQILNIKSSIPEKHRLQISNWKNLYKIALLNLTHLHPKKLQTFVKGIKNHYTLRLLSNLKFIKKHLAVTEYQKLINTKYRSTAERQLKLFLKLNLVSRKKEKVYKYYITKQGNKLLTNLE